MSDEEEKEDAICMKAGSIEIPPIQNTKTII
jgi:hypothetical protein